MNLFKILIILANLTNLILNCIVYGTEQLEESLCKTKSCPFYGKCKIDEHGFVAKCICPNECDLSDLTSGGASQLFMIGDYEINNNQHQAIGNIAAAVKSKEEITSSLFGQTVCGSDGFNYKSYCDLKKESCKSSREIKIFYFGKCSKFILNILLSIHTKYIFGAN